MMPDEPLHMTLAEAMIYLSDRDMTLACRGTSADFPKSRWMVIGHAYANTMGEGETWEEAVSAALGRPVLARDDTTELVEALERIANPRNFGEQSEAKSIARAALAKWKERNP